MRIETFCKGLWTFVLFFTLSTNSWAQTPGNGDTYTIEQAKPYLETSESESSFEYFSVDKSAYENVKKIFKSSNKVDHVRMTPGKIGDADYLFTIGLDIEGKFIGDYLISEMLKNAVVGPCPRNCDTN